MRYYLYQSENKNYGSNINDWAKNAKLLNEGGSIDINQWNITGLNNDSDYSFMLVVEDEEGNKTAYDIESIAKTSLNNNVSHKDNFEKAKVKTLEFISKYDFKSNMSWADFTDALTKELSEYGITSTGDNATILNGTVTGEISLYINSEVYKFPFTAQASDIKNTNVTTTENIQDDINIYSRDAEWSKNADGTWNLAVKGKVATGWQQVDGRWYYLNKNGIMQTGWLNESGQWYYLYNNGSMAVNKIIDGYTLGANGQWLQSAAGYTGTSFENKLLKMGYFYGSYNQTTAIHQLFKMPGGQSASWTTDQVVFTTSIDNSADNAKDDIIIQR